MNKEVKNKKTKNKEVKNKKTKNKKVIKKVVVKEPVKKVSIMERIYNNFIETYKKCKKEPWLFLLSAGIDFAFIFIYVVVSILGYDAVEGKFAELSVKLQETSAMVGLNAQVSASVDAVNSLTSMFSEIVMYLVIYSLIIFVLFLLFEGINWFIANKIVHHKVKFWNYMKKFSLSALSYYLVYLFVALISVWISFRTLFENEKTINWFVLVIASVVFYFMLINLSITGRFKFSTAFNKTFKIGGKKFVDVILTYLVIAVIFVGINMFLRLVRMIGYLPWFITAAVILMGAIAFVRIFLIRSFTIKK